MATEPASIPPAARSRGAMGRRLLRERPGWLRLAEEVAGTVDLGVRSLRALVSRPFDWTAEFVEQSALIVRRAALPIALSSSLFSVAVTLILQAGLLQVLGATDRTGLLTANEALREPAAWVTGMILAGVAGTAMCSDLGSRRVREELDALAVIGVDLYRTLVLPRVLAITLMGPVMFLWSVFWWCVPPFVLGPTVLGIPLASIWETFQTYPIVDLYAGLVKMVVIGFLVGLVCCFKGVNASGGPEGVGRSVNQAVVISFLLTWVLSLLMNMFYLAAFPSTQALR